jgi:hypothetical protein
MHNGRVIELTEPQVWVLIGVFAAAIFGMLSWQTISINRTITAVADRLDAKIDGLREATDAKFDTVSAKLDNLDRDVQALTRHVFGADPR